MDQAKETLKRLAPSDGEMVDRILEWEDVRQSAAASQHDDSTLFGRFLLDHLPHENSIWLRPVRDEECQFDGYVVRCLCGCTGEVRLSVSNVIDSIR